MKGTSHKVRINRKVQCLRDNLNYFWQDKANTLMYIFSWLYVSPEHTYISRVFTKTDLRLSDCKSDPVQYDLDENIAINGYANYL